MSTEEVIDPSQYRCSRCGDITFKKFEKVHDERCESLNLQETKAVQRFLDHLFPSKGEATPL